mgnify:CR=1 FL=1
MKFSWKFAVNTVVWVKKPGPIADVAIINAAPNNTDQLDFFPLVITGSAII